MTYALRFLPEVEDDVIAAYDWYEEKAPGLGEEFLRVFYAYAGSIPQNPLLYPKVHREFRRRLLIRFPYAVYFRIEDNTIVVYGLFHCARNPRTIKAMLQNRH
ncbi:MAG: type II toxin-antitoxin system RelE/ParE family toxin [Deltaproteobacteria bacterium]|nr:type II toxin-antitoxin system RelE/ParE family toxin [Deltaproteobacteria bacterium]